ncbi:MAG: MoxR family ATPase [Saprospiraceae bacterium]|nr:MoxR family ATPase [Saprospiraceae bacterium]
MAKAFDIYKAEGQTELPDIQLNPRLHDPSLYLPSQGLVSAVNVALNLGLPLLLTGEPGTGKTQLAYHIAYHFRLGNPLVFNAQTTSVAKDLFYRYDALGHFQYNQAQQTALSSEQIERNYIRYQALGEAIRSNRRAVVLLDEIDKAPRDLPNDVLAALEELRFRVPEIDKSFEAQPANRPIIIMTSNSEKNLPDAFLRRVVYYHIPFPDKEALLKILQLKVTEMSDEAFRDIIAHFEMLRSGRRAKLKKNPATAELIQWALLLQKIDFPTGKLNEPEKLTEEERQHMRLSYSVLAKNKDDLHMLQEQI